MLGASAMQASEQLTAAATFLKWVLLQWPVRRSQMCLLTAATACGSGLPWVLLQTRPPLPFSPVIRSAVHPLAVGHYAFMHWVSLACSDDHGHGAHGRLVGSAPS